MSKHRIDAKEVPIVVVPDDEPNPSNPYSSASAEEREAALVEVVRGIVLRRLRAAGRGNEGRGMDETADNAP